MDRLDILGERIRLLREARQMSQRTLGTRAGTSGSRISQLEAGTTAAKEDSDPGLFLVHRIAKVLGVTLNDLVEEVKDDDESWNDLVRAKQYASIVDSLPMPEPHAFIIKLGEVDAEGLEKVNYIVDRLVPGKKRR